MRHVNSTNGIFLSYSLAYLHEAIPKEKGCINDVQSFSSVPRGIEASFSKTKGKTGRP